MGCISWLRINLLDNITEGNQMKKFAVVASWTQFYDEEEADSIYYDTPQDYERETIEMIKDNIGLMLGREDTQDLSVTVMVEE
jgi:hypothetical protein